MLEGGFVERDLEMRNSKVIAVKPANSNVVYSFKEYHESVKNSKPTPKMVDWYNERTNTHIQHVRYFMKKLVDKFPEFEKRMDDHDLSKFEEPEKEAYIWITWKSKCLDEGWDFEKYNPPSDIDELMNAATHHHITHNSHHPEYHTPNQVDLLNRDDRDKPPEKMVDATAMPEIDLAEMCCDWSAMSKEKGGTPQEWAKKNVNVRWEFTEDQEKFIFDTLDEIWEKKEEKQESDTSN